jgi:MIZ/SP-RING zinc finger
MQQPNNSRPPTTQDLQAARRLAESNATTNHFLGASPRPWMMTNAVPIPRIAAESRVLQSNNTRIASNLPQSAGSGNVQNTTRGEGLGQGTERSQSAQNQDTSSIVEQVPPKPSDGDAMRKRRFDVSGLEFETRRRSTLPLIEQPTPMLPVPLSEAERGVDALSDAPLSTTNQSQQLTISAMHSLNSFQAKLGSMSKIEAQRISLLREACVQRDLFYLCLHQIFCVAFLDPRRAIDTGYGEEQYAGINLLTLILLSNQDMSVQVLRFFADLPAPFEVLMKDPIVHRNIVMQVGAFLRRFAAGWDWLRNKCFARKFPPFVDELVVVFEVHSPVLQRVLFSSIHRQLGATDDATWSKQGFRLFNENQAQYQARKRNLGDARIRTETEIMTEQKLLGEQYKVLRERATNADVQSAPAEQMITATRFRPQPLSISPHQALSGSFSSRPASTSLTYSPSPVQYADSMQWASMQNSLSRSQSASTLRASTQPANTATAGLFSASRVQLPPSSMNPPVFVSQLFPARVQTSIVSAAGQGGQQSVPQRRQGRPPLSNRSVCSHTAPSLHHHGPGGPGSPPGYVHSQPSVVQLTSTTFSFIPAIGIEPIQTSNPDPARLALHQAYLRTPIAEKLNAEGQKTPDLRLYQYLTAFATSPHVLDSKTALLSLDFLITAPEISKRAVDITASDGQSKRLLSDGCVLYRLRSIEVARGLDPLEEADWSVQDTCWPSSCFVKINDVDIELRRKLHHGKDLPVDLTPHVREGTNTITIAFLHSPEGKKPKRHAMAVEVLEVGDQTRVNSAPIMLPANESLRSITQGLAMPHGKPTDDNDDEVQVVDPHISIDLIDPFMATIFETPARGKTCTHRECFDLPTFFQTRKSRAKNGPTSPDEWKCPICKKDARPSSLVVDCFLKTVRDSLVASGATLNARAILIGIDGSWNVKKEGVDATGNTREDSNATVAESLATTKGTMTGNVSRSHSVVIEIDDD